jgi:hypothetical protein
VPRKNRRDSGSKFCRQISQIKHPPASPLAGVPRGIGMHSEAGNTGRGTRWRGDASRFAPVSRTHFADSDDSRRCFGAAGKYCRTRSSIVCMSASRSSLVMFPSRALKSSSFSSTSFSETLAVGPVRKIGRSARASPASRTDLALPSHHLAEAALSPVADLKSVGFQRPVTGFTGFARPARRALARLWPSAQSGKSDAVPGRVRLPGPTSNLRD